MRNLGGGHGASPMKSGFSFAEQLGFLSLILAGIFFFFSALMAIAVLVFFLVFVGVAPFCTSRSFFLPVICRCHGGGSKVVLTFDDGPSPESTSLLLKLLERYKIPATFFVIGEKAERYPDLIRKIVADGHDLGNHSYSHDYALMLRTTRSIEGDIGKGQEVLVRLGGRPRFFRPPVGITGPRLQGALDNLDLVTVNYSCRALDRGNRNIENMARKILMKVQPGDIIMLHDLPVHDDKQRDQWETELDYLFKKLTTEYGIAPLSECLPR